MCECSLKDLMIKSQGIVSLVASVLSCAKQELMLLIVHEENGEGLRCLEEGNKKESS